ncbi:MAG: peroxiredoxin [Rhodocyclaceae bacterium]|nr:peroxiredoxin [Rhodocyclaceae bacterium]
MLRPGDRAPLFALPDADMEMFELADALASHRVVLYFYPRANTPGCTRQAADFTDRENEFSRHGCVVVGISPDDCLTLAEFRDEHGLSVRLLSDEDSEICRMYDVWRKKEVDGFSKMAVLRSTFIIDRDGVIRHALYDVNPRGHAAEVLELVRAMDARNTHNGNR